MLLAGLATGCAETQHTDPDLSDKQYQIGADCFSKGMNRPALEELLEAVATNPNNAEAQHLIGLLSLRQAADDEALIEQQSCLPADEAKLERQEVDRLFREAEERFRKAVASRPDFSEGWNSLAVVALHFREWDRAIEASHRALGNAIYRQPWAALGNLGWALFQKGDLLRATQELRSSLQANPAFCVGRFRLAKVRYQQKRFDEAAEDLEKVTSDPRCLLQEAHQLAGLVALHRADRARATEAFKRCVELGPRSCLAKECRPAL